jgi:hypothetical protein
LAQRPQRIHEARAQRLAFLARLRRASRSHQRVALGPQSLPQRLIALQ